MIGCYIELIRKDSQQKMIKNIKRFLPLSILFTLASCSLFKDDSKNIDLVNGAKDFADSIVSRIQPIWFTGAKRFSLTDTHGEEAVHLFYDVKPEINLVQKTLNFIVKTPEQSEYHYEIDLASGQRYGAGRYCKQNDIWGKFDDTIEKANFTQGLVPRLLDQIGEPQKIMIYGGKNYISENYQQNFFDARIIGAFIEQVCDSGGCLNIGDWKSRIVLIGVLKGDDRFAKVDNISDLEKLVDWNYSKAFIENGQGKNRIGKNVYPAFRVGALLSSDQALRYIDKNSISLSNTKLLETRKSCYRLYDHIWNQMGEDSKLELEVQKISDNNEKYKYLRSQRSRHGELFFKRFVSNMRKYKDEYTTCLKFIYPASIEDNPRRNWFFAYYSMIHLVVDMNYTFDCSRSMWVKNGIKIDGKRVVEDKNMFARCDARRIDIAFEFAASILQKQKTNNEMSYRYIDFDRNYFGTHNKIYSWVKDNHKYLSCLDQSVDPFSDLEVFPLDVKWRKRQLRVNMTMGEIF